ncbi:MAG: cytochrome c1 [Betaproteobacteria bacterium]|nr:cytochrome c1 [Betaproteobacteria bacterium]
MKRLIACVMLAAGLAGGAAAAEGGYPMDHAPSRINDLASLQNGAKMFVNYCMGCHSAAYMRYNRMHDIGLTDAQIKDNLIFNGAKVGDLMTIAMQPKDAKAWFGGVPPDLTLIARSRAGEGYSGPDYIYTLLRTFYRDGTRPTGWNNLAFPGIGMPNPLWELQGQRTARFEKVKNESGETVEHFVGFTQVTPGKLSAVDYDRTVGDIVNFLQWMGEPAQETRQRIGVWVLLFIALFTVVAWRLNAAYWKDIK